MKTRLLRPLTCCLLILSATAGLLRADRAADLRSEIVPPRARMKPPLREYTGSLQAPNGSPTGLTPQFMRHAYGLDQLNTTGQGQVIAIVDAYGSATIQSDLDTFSAAMGIPSTAVHVYYAQGTAGTDPDFPGWATETSLDVEWAHAVAPGATIALIVAQSSNDNDLYSAVDFAASLPGVKQVSMSWGGPEYSSENSSDFHFNVPGVTFFASSGDSGANSGGVIGVSYPAASPNVVSVGGTTLNIDSSGNYLSETAWYNSGDGSGSGGGVSLYETFPGYQSGWWNGSTRGVPDVAFDADPATGVPVYLTTSGWGQWGGTSLSSPCFAAISALANSLRTQPISPTPGIFYSLATTNYAGYYHDITSNCNPTYCAGPKYDLITGLGSPVGNQLVIALAGGYSAQAATPVFFPLAGVYPSGTAQNVSIVSATPGASIRYTTDGSTPTETHGTVYSVPVSISTNTTITALAYASGLADSPVNSASYTFQTQVAAPTFSPAIGTYHSAQTVTITTATSGATIRYTTDGSIPTETSGTIYTAPVTLSAVTTLNAIAYKSGFLDSPVTGGLYNITPLVILYDFTTANNVGTNPWASLMQASDGNFYGTTTAGGSNNDGMVFKMTPAGSVTALAAFTGANPNYPDTALIQGSDGNFYGVTEGDGSTNSGSVFKVTPAGVLTTLVTFNGTNGSSPFAPLVQGSDGNFYGTTQFGGANDDGTVFKVTPTGTLTTLVTFNGTNGSIPYAPLVHYSDGNFYGTTGAGGINSAGTVFKMTPAGVLTTLVTFNGDNGLQPVAPLTLGYDGNFYGTTSIGGPGFYGTIFKMTPAGRLTNLFTFSGSNGEFPRYLVQRIDGNFYGTTGSTGINQGTIFKITPAGVMTTVATLIDSSLVNPNSLIQGTDNNLYGTSSGMGGLAYGTIFQVVFPPQVLPPAFSPAAGVYSSSTTVKISTGTSGASIRYTTNGTTPTETNGTLYSSSVKISSTCTLQAIAYKSGLPDSIVISGFYVIGTRPQVATPAFSPAAGTYTAIKSVAISTTTSGASISYTTDGSTPSEANGTLYSGPVTIGATTKLQAVAFKQGYTTSKVTSGTYTIKLPPAAAPTLNPSAGTYANPQSVTISTTTSGATIRYTTDGSTPSETAGTLYSGPVPINLTLTLKAIAYKYGMSDSKVTSGVYTILNPSQASPPTFSPAAGTYSYFKAVSLSTTTGSASIRYTTDGSVPTETTGTLYTGPFNLYVSATLQAVAYKSGLIDSSVATANYTINSLSLLAEMPGGTNAPNLLDAALVLGTDGNFYGTADFGGSSNNGAVLKVTPAGGLTTLASFNGTNGTDPNRGMIQGRDGNFYGMTSSGGTANLGAIYKVTPAGVLTSLASFSGANGADPLSVLVQGSDGNFYGTTSAGGSANLGTVFKITPAGALTTLGSFTGPNGSTPYAGLALGSDGNFYGTASAGGSANLGTVYKITPAGVLTTLVSFTGLNGDNPIAALTLANDGNFYGTTSYGGSGYVSPDNSGFGTAFKMTAAGVLTTVVSFDGNVVAWPSAKLTQGRDGNFYSTNYFGGSDTEGYGNVFMITPEGVVTVLGWFDLNNGANPFAGLAQGTDGNFYGTAEFGGTTGNGTIFKLVLPPQAAAPAFSPAAGIYTGAQTVTITSTTSGATIRYTTDGSIPTEATGTLYSGPVSISSTTTLKAVAYEVGYTDSTVTTGLYTIGTFSQVVAPIFSPGAGTYTSTVSVAITTTTTGASIRYTTDGSTPSETAGTLYSSAIPISVTTTLNAIAYKSGMTDSTVTTGLYTIIPTTRSLTGSSGDGFHALALTTAQTGTFTATFDATPSVSPENAVVGLSKGVATAYTGLSCIARFNTSGQIDAYNGTAYGTSTITYIANLSYHFRLVVNVPAHTYSVYVTPSGGSELTVGLNYAFRVAQTSLDTWNIDVNATPAGCKLTAVNLNP